MNFRTGKQYSIGNGSTLVFLGTHRTPCCSTDPDDFMTYVQCLAYIQCETLPEGRSFSYVAWNHAAALRCIMCDCFLHNDDKLIWHMHKKEQNLCIVVRRCISGGLRNKHGFMKNLAGTLHRAWDVVHYAEYGGAVSNNVITSDVQCPIQPNMFSLEIENCPLSREEKLHSTARWKDTISLGFGSVWEDRVAFCILMQCCNAKKWDPFGYADTDHNSFFLNDVKLYAFLSIPSDYVHRILDDFVNNGHLSYNKDTDQFSLRENFIVQCWRGSLRLSEEEEAPSDLC